MGRGCLIKATRKPNIPIMLKTNVLLTADELDLYVSGCVHNDRESQKRIYEAFYTFCMAICERYTYSQAEASEILNDGFLKIFREMHNYKPSYSDKLASFKGWIRKIMVYTAIDHYRKEKKHAILTGLDTLYISIPAKSVSMVDKISYDEIILMIKKLSPAYRTVLNLFIVEGFSHDEIARHLDISVGTSKSNLTKARRQLQKIFYNENKILLERNAG
jgi:RNA polymerase sigma-70 factor (ECF subfamily)